MAFRSSFFLVFLATWVLYAAQVAEARDAPVLTYRSKIELQDVRDIRKYVKRYFEESGIQTKEDYGPGADLVTRGSSGFITYGYLEGKLIYIVSNIGVGDIISIYVFDDGQTPQSTIEEQAQKLTTALESQYNLNFYQKR